MADLSKKFDDAKDLSQAFDALPGEVSSDSNEYGALGAGALGAVKGATFAFDDEIGAFTKALYDKGVGGKKDGFWDLYKKVKETINKEHATAEEQQPVASFAGEMIGGIGSAALAPGALVGKGVAAGANYLTKAKALGAAGAKAGALYGLGASEADLTEGEVGQAAADTAGGAASGAVIGGVAMPALTDAASRLGKGAWNIAKSYPVVGENVEVFKKALSGIDLLGKGNETTKTVDLVARASADLMESLRSKSGNARQLAIDAVSDTGLKIDIDAWANKHIAKAEAQLAGAGSEDVKGIQDFIKQIKNHVGEVTSDVTTHVPIEAIPGTNPQDIAMGKVQATMTKRALADKELANQLQKDLANKIESGEIGSDDDSIARMQGVLNKIKKLRAGNEFAPEIQTDSGTELDAIINPRGTGKTPVVEDIKLPKPEEFDTKDFFAPVKSQVVERTKTLQSPSEISKIATNLGSEYPMGEGKNLTRSLYGEAKQELQKQMNAEAKLPAEAGKDAIDKFNDLLASYKDETGKFINTAKTQEILSQPGFAATANGKDKIPVLQHMIESYNKPGSNARLVLDKAIQELSLGFPNEAKQIREMIEVASKNRDIALGLSSQSPLSTNLLHASAKSIMFQIARLGGMATRGVSNNTGAASDALIATGNAIYGASPQTIQAMADKGAKLGGAFGNMIAKTLGTIANAPQAKQRAVMFTLMQQPDFRKFVQEHMAEGP